MVLLDARHGTWPISQSTPADGSHYCYWCTSHGRMRRQEDPNLDTFCLVRLSPFISDFNEAVGNQFSLVDVTWTGFSSFIQTTLIREFVNSIHCLICFQSRSTWRSIGVICISDASFDRNCSNYPTVILPTSNVDWQCVTFVAQMRSFTRIHADTIAHS